MNYSTSFAGTENPISEGANWRNGLADGLDWHDVRTASAAARPTTGTSGVSDSIACLTGSWGPDQTVQGTALVSGADLNDELELHVRCTITANTITSYECDFEVAGAISIIRWNGASGDFTVIQGQVSLGRAIVTGDILGVRIVGGVITASFNGVDIVSIADSTFTNGSPGMGFDLGGADVGSGINFTGLTAFSATDGLTGVAARISDELSRRKFGRNI